MPVIASWIPSDLGWMIAIGVFSVCLVGIVLALIFMTEFRRDLLAGDGSAEVFGVFSVQGAIVVIMCVVFVFGMVYALGQVTRDPIPVQNVVGDASRTRADSATEPVSAPVEVVRSDPEPGGEEVDPTASQLVAWVAALDRDHAASADIRELARQHKGPWGVGEARPVTISPHGRTGVLACPEFPIGDDIQFMYSGREVVEARVTGHLFLVRNCAQIAGHDFKVTCDLAQDIFGEAAVACSNQGYAPGLAAPDTLRAYVAPV